MSKVIQVNTIQCKKSFSEFRKAFQQGIDGIVKASNIYVKALDQDPRNADRFKEQFKDMIPDSAWAGFEAVGRKWLHPRMLMGGVSDRRKNAAIKKLPYSAQERVFKKELVSVVVDSRIEKIDLLSATADVVEQVCDTSGLRSVDQQMQYIKTKSMPKELVKKLPYVITHGKVYFTSGTLMSKEELENVIAEMSDAVR